MHIINLPVNRALTNLCKDHLAGNDWGKRGHTNGTPDNQLTGLLCELETHRYFYGEYPELTVGADVGYDIAFKGLRIDVKAARWYVPNDSETNCVFDLQIKRPANCFVFCSHYIKDNTIAIKGYLSKPSLLVNAEYLPVGSRLTKPGGSELITKAAGYFVTDDQLYPVNDLKNILHGTYCAEYD